MNIELYYNGHAVTIFPILSLILVLLINRNVPNWKKWSFLDTLFAMIFGFLGTAYILIKDGHFILSRYEDKNEDNDLKKSNRAKSKKKVVKGSKEFFDNIFDNTIDTHPMSPRKHKKNIDDNIVNAYYHPDYDEPLISVTKETQRRHHGGSSQRGPLPKRVPFGEKEKEFFDDNIKKEEIINDRV